MKCYCFHCWKGGVLVAVVDDPVEGRLKKKILLFIVVVDIVDGAGAGAGGFGAVRGGNL